MTITSLRDGLTLIVDNRVKLAAVGENDGTKTSAQEVIRRLGKAAAAGLAKGNEIAPKGAQKDQLELTKEHSKPLDMGI